MRASGKVMLLVQSFQSLVTFQIESGDFQLLLSMYSYKTHEEELLALRFKWNILFSDTAYQNSVRMLEDARVVWEKEMDQCCDVSTIPHRIDAELSAKRIYILVIKSVAE